MNHAEFKEILQRYQADSATEQERAFVNAYYAAFEGRPDIMELLSTEEQEKLEQLLYKDLRDQFPMARPAHRVHFLKTTWPTSRQAGFKYAAAILLIITGIALYYTVFHTSQSDKGMVQTTPSPKPEADVLPGSDRAILTLSNGHQVQLNNATSETIKDGTLSIKNNNGQLSYTSAGLPIPSTGGVARSAGVGHNTMSTPRGGQYQLTLSDGTRVWLNAASSITYPIAFTKETRQVSITGEAYFEVKPNKEKPFIVKTRSDEVTVLGTSFNVNAYEDEAAVKTSLLEGIVKVGDTNIKPGQAFKNGKVITTDVTRDVAWKNGYFNFDGADLETVMRQLARWYDLEIIYEGAVPQIKFVGKMTRNISLNGVLKGLKGAGVQFRVENRRLIVR